MLPGNMRKSLIDTNILIRFLTSDDPIQSDKAKRLFANAKKNEIVIPDFILAESVWVLLYIYKLSKPDILEKLESVLNFEKFEIKRPVLRQALDLYRQKNISFIDAYLGALSNNIKYKGLYTFDKALQKIKSIKILKI